MKTHIDADEVEITRSERLLAVVLAAFLLVGLLWAYVQLGDVQQGLGDNTVTAGLRLLLVLGSLAGALRLMLVLRRGRSSWIVVGYAGVGAATVLALVMAGDYLSDLVNPTELGPLVLSLVGAAFTLAAIAGLQRYLKRRIPARRVRRAECPFCGYPVRGEHCEGCGRAVLAPCARCTQPRRVGARHCAVCGET
jgi:peptidoglycan/LPS O-acetylase OafA/YrhL